MPTISIREIYYTLATIQDEVAGVDKNNTAF